MAFGIPIFCVSKQAALAGSLIDAADKDCNANNSEGKEMISRFSRFAAVGVLVAAAAATPAFAVVLPGLAPSGDPAIVFDDTRITVASQSSGGWSLSGRGNGEFSLSQPGGVGMPYYGEGTFTLDATFNSSGTLTGGSVSILGFVTGLNGSRKDPLFSADLVGFGSSSNMLGFQTTNIWCASFIEVNGFECTPEETVYFVLNDAFEWLGFGNIKKKQTLVSQSITTLPVPATLPLFLTGFAVALRWMRHRPKV